MEGHNSSMDTEEGILTEYLNIPIFKVERVMWSHGCGVSGPGVNRRGVCGEFVVEIARDGEVGEGCDTGGRRACY